MSSSIKIDPFGFREYDARWLYPKIINEAGIKEVGKGFGTQGSQAEVERSRRKGQSLNARGC